MRPCLTALRRHIPQIRQICQLREESKGWGNPNRGILLSNPKGPAMEVLRWYLFDIFVQVSPVQRCSAHSTVQLRHHVLHHAGLAACVLPQYKPYVQAL